MYIIGLTGGIGSGKSTVSDYLKRKGCLIIDADEISRAATGPGGPALEPILREFGPKVFNEDGTLDRAKMADLVFADPYKRNKLEDIVVTMVINEFHAQIDHLKEEDHKGIVVFDAPLLFEFGLQQYVDETFGGSLPAFLAAFGTRKKLNESEIDELKSIIDSMRR